MADWPFSSAELTAGLRRYFAEPRLRVRALVEIAPPARGQTSTVRALRVTYAAGDGPACDLQCIVKEPRGATRRGLAGVGRREIGLYQALARHLPLATPALIAADTAGDWLVLETVDIARPPADWRAEDYRQTVRALAGLHERFWGLADDLSAFPWLARPLAGDFEIYVYAAAQAVERMIHADRPRLITGSVRHLGLLGQIISQIETVAAPLRAAPQTLLHGDFWPGNLAWQSDDELVVLDWQAAGLGPGVLDLAAFVTTSQWELDPLPIAPAELVALYRAEMAERLGVTWEQAAWDELWDQALIWRFVQEMFAWLDSAAPEAYAAREAQFEALWLQPVLAAVERRLRPALYF